MPSPSLRPSVPVSQVGRAAHDVGLLDGQLFGRMAMHPAVTEISDPRERARSSTPPGGATA